MPYIDVRFHFDTVTGDGYTFYDLVSAERTGTDIPAAAMGGIGEGLGQSDSWNTGGVGVTLDAMTSEGPKELRGYW